MVVTTRTPGTLGLPGQGVAGFGTDFSSWDASGKRRNVQTHPNPPPTRDRKENINDISDVTDTGADA